MRNAFAIASLIAVLFSAAPAGAELAPGARATLFTAEGAVAGHKVPVDLKAALKKGPVVLYFFPAAFTGGCNAEAHAFAEAIDDFKAAGATVIGMTSGNTNQLVKFSSAYCAGKFAVAPASVKVASAYDVTQKSPDGSVSPYTTRTSYVITPAGRIYYAHTDTNPATHIRNTLAAVQRYRATRRS